MHTQHINNHTKTAFYATLHCLTGCAIGKVAGVVLGTALGFSNIATIVLAVVLAFIFGYTLTLIPLIKSGISLKKALSIAFAADTISITVMEIVDNGVLYFIPGALDAHVMSFHFWISLAFALFVGFLAAYPVNWYLLSRGKSQHHHHH